MTNGECLCAFTESDAKIVPCSFLVSPSSLLISKDSSRCAKYRIICNKGLDWDLNRVMLSTAIDCLTKVQRINTTLSKRYQQARNKCPCQRKKDLRSPVAKFLPRECDPRKEKAQINKSDPPNSRLCNNWVLAIRIVYRDPSSHLFHACVPHA